MNPYDGNGCQFSLFTKELRQIAEILEAKGMSAELINMTLAARAGLPVAPVDPKSPAFVWVEEQAETPAPEAQPRSLDECREAVLHVVAVLDRNDVVDVLTSVLNRVLATTRYTATVNLHHSISYGA